MIEPPATRERRWPAWAWLALVLALAWHQAGFWREARLDSDVMALLPAEQQDPVLERASQRLAQHATRQVVIALGADDWDDARAAAQATIGSLRESALPLQRVDAPAEALDGALDYYRAQRAALLTSEQRDALRQTSVDAQVGAALRRLFQPGPAGSGLTSWQDDPLGLWPAWWQARSGEGANLRDGLLSVEHEGRHWSVLRFDYAHAAFRLDGERHLLDALDAAADAARAAVAPRELRVARGGVPLHAETEAVQASREVGTIGLGSLLAVMALMWIAFRGPRPLLLVSASLLIGCAAGVSVTAMLFGHVHLLTLVFGASLVGVAEDYGIHYFATRQARPDAAPRALMRELMPGLLLALVTSVLAYLALGAAPFPGLRQMAVFSATGLIAAFLTAVLWFPWMDRRAPRPSALGAAIASTLRRWPRVSGMRAWALAAVLLGFSAAGLAQLHADDSLRSLRGATSESLADETMLARLLALPSPAQFFLVEGGDAEMVLQREEALVAQLAEERARGRLGGWRALSDWIPSAQRQQQDRALVQPIEREARARAAALLDEAPPMDTALSLTLRLEDWLQLPIAEPFRPLWLDDASVVLLQGVGSHTDLQALQRIADELEGVRWVDRSAQISSLLQHYRRMIGWLLLAGYAAVAVALFARYRRAAWRALLPTALAAVLSLALLGWIGQPLQLFAVLAQLLLLGIGVDYGIFLLEHRDDPASWLAVSLGAASTWLAFGLLALSATPALRSFGLTLMFGIALVWLLSPLFRAPPSNSLPAS